MADDGQAISSTNLLILGIIGGLIFIYLSTFNATIGPLFACLGGVCAIIWGSDAIRRVASYGLGTGVPSIGYMSLGAGIVAGLAGLAIAAQFNMIFLGPIAALIFGMIIGLIIAVVAKKVVGMKIPVLERCTTELAGAAALSVVAFSAAIAGSIDFTAILNQVVATGFIALLFILNTMAIQHPYNACLGPNEDQVRTLKCAASTAFLSMIIVGICTIPIGHSAWLIVIVVGLIGWIIAFRSFVQASYEAAASVKWSGLWPKTEE
jgi:tetrahydromethanopterin S-methyltransferase subunit C